MVEPPWLNAVASVIIAVLVELSLILMATTMFPNVDVTQLFVYLSLCFRAWAARGGRLPARAPGDGAGSDVPEIPRERRQTWTMPPLALLERPVWSPGRKAAMLLLRGYLVVAVLLLVIKTVQLGHWAAAGRGSLHASWAPH